LLRPRKTGRAVTDVLKSPPILGSTTRYPNGPMRPWDMRSSTAACITGRRYENRTPRPTNLPFRQVAPRRRRNLLSCPSLRCRRLGIVAAKRRKNAAHAVRRGQRLQNDHQAPEGRKITSHQKELIGSRAKVFHSPASLQCDIQP